ncbi:MAG: DUF6917 domain-containing protein [Burkholderiales bacterium]
MATVVRKKRAAGSPRLLRKPLEARFVEVMDLECNDRALVLMKERSRAVRHGDIHELMLTDETAPAPGGTADGIDYVGFIEFQAGGVLVYGDTVMIAGQFIGTIAGFDECHAPNHYNILIKGPRRASGVDLEQWPGDAVLFEPVERE